MIWGRELGFVSLVSLANLLCVSSIFDLFIGYDYVSQDIPQLYSGRTPQFYVPVS